MTWLGKILAFAVLVMSLAGVWLTTTAFVTRTNWKTQADMYKDAYTKAVAARSAEYSTYVAERDAMAKQLGSEQQKVSDLTRQVADRTTADEKTRADFASLNKVLTDSDIKAAQLAANLDNVIKQVESLLARNNKLEDDKVRMTREREDALRDKLAAENTTKQAVADRDEANRKLEDATARIAELKTGGGVGFVKPPPTVPEGTRGTVTAFSGNLVSINIGADLGLAQGAVLDVYRTAGEPKYLGTITIDTLKPKEATGIFRPADIRRPISQLRDDEKPKAGDIVAKPRG